MSEKIGYRIRRGLRGGYNRKTSRTMFLRYDIFCSVSDVGFSVSPTLHLVRLARFADFYSKKGLTVRQSRLVVCEPSQDCERARITSRQALSLKGPDGKLVNAPEGLFFYNLLFQQ